MKPNMNFRALADPDLFVVVYGPNDPTNAEWLEYLNFVERSGITSTPQLVVSDGGAPTFAQIRYLADILSGQTVRVAVVADSLRVRTVAMLMSAFNREIKAFLPTRSQGAFDHLKLDRRQMAAVQKVVLHLRGSVRAA